ncbi:MAG: class I SAM-dependent methyltransferase [Nanoarchaeota archaeon]|nr:class I SAM-dependent methyltransferase [Nanoarchaeota archaeon]
MKKQQEIWDNIAEEWCEFKTEPAWNTLDFLKKQKGNILDLGSGSGRHLIKIKNGKMWLVDFSEKMIKLAKEKAKQQNIKAEFEVTDLTKLPFKKSFFDSAIWIDSIHCIPEEKNREKAIQELFRVLKPEAKALITVWNKDSKRFKNSPKEKYIKWRDKGARYYYLFDEKEIHQIFEKNGFNILEKFTPSRKISFIIKKPKFKNAKSLVKE